MHDALGKELKVGDSVVVLGKITNLSAGEDYCNITVECQLPRRPDGAKDMLCINTGSTVKVGE